jgi:hypothetical protein
MGNQEDVDAFVERMEQRLSEGARGSAGGRHRAAFIALRPLIEGALGRGYSMRATWAALVDDKRVSMSYQAFRLHCRRAGIGRRTQHPKPLPAPTAPQRPTGFAGAQPSAGVGGEPKARGFQHHRVPRKDEIYGP